MSANLFYRLNGLLHVHARVEYGIATQTGMFRPEIKWYYYLHWHILDIPYVNSVLTVKMETTLFLCDEDVAITCCYNVSPCHVTQYHHHTKIKLFPSSLSALSLHTLLVYMLFLNVPR